jgi:hypothetical protein
LPGALLLTPRFLLRDGVLTSFRAPGAPFTEAHGINDAGTIVRFYNDGNQASGSVLSGGAFTTIRDPGALDTAIYGINDAGPRSFVRLAARGGLLLDRDMGATEAAGPKRLALQRLYGAVEVNDE